MAKVEGTGGVVEGAKEDGLAAEGLRAPFAGALARVLVLEHEDGKRLRAEHATMLATLTAAQERGTALALQNQQLRALLAIVQRNAEDIRAFLGQASEGALLSSFRDAALDRVLTITGACAAAEAVRR